MWFFLGLFNDPMIGFNIENTPKINNKKQKEIEKTLNS